MNTGTGDGACVRFGNGATGDGHEVSAHDALDTLVVACEHDGRARAALASCATGDAITYSIANLRGEVATATARAECRSSPRCTKSDVP